MAAEDGGHLLEPVAPRSPPGPGGTCVQLAALRAQQAVVGRLADQGVAEPVRGLGLAARLGQQAGRDELGERVVELCVELAHRCEGRALDLLAEHRGRHDRLTSRWAEPVDAGCGSAARAPQGAALAVALADSPAALGARERPGVEQRRQALLQEQRVAVDPVADHLENLVVGLAPEQRAGQGLRSADFSSAASSRRWNPRAGSAESSASSSPTPGSGSGRRVASTSSGPRRRGGRGGRSGAAMSGRTSAGPRWRARSGRARQGA